MPATWDETRLISGDIGKHVAIARRKGYTWYIAVVNGEDQAKTLPLTIPPAMQGSFRLIGDTTGPEGNFTGKAELHQVKLNHSFSLKLAPQGGALLISQ